MTLALLLAMALAVDQPASSAEAPPAPAASAAPDSSNAGAPPPAASEAGPMAGGVGGAQGGGHHLTREQMEDAIPAGAPTDDYEYVAWCHGALAGQVELDPIVEKDMDAIEGKTKAAARRAGDAEIAKEHKRYLALYEKALAAAEKASPVALHQKGVDAELLGYRIWGATRNKAPIWRMVDWGNWEVPPSCEKVANRLYDRSSLLGAALKNESDPAAPAAGPGSAAPAEASAPAANPASEGRPGPL